MGRFQIFIINIIFIWDVISYSLLDKYQTTQPYVRDVQMGNKFQSNTPQKSVIFQIKIMKTVEVIYTRI